MDPKREKPTKDIEDRRGDKPPAFRPPKERSWAEAITEFDDQQQRVKDRMIKNIGENSKTPEEFNAKVRELERKMRQGRDEADESSNDAVKAWEASHNGKKSPEMAKALKDISNVTAKFDKKKFKNYEGYASGGVVRGYGKARGGRACKVR